MMPEEFFSICSMEIVEEDKIIPKVIELGEEKWLGTVERYMNFAIQTTYFTLSFT